MNDLLSSILLAAAGEPVALNQAVARALLNAVSDAEIANAIGLSRRQRVSARDSALVEAARVLSTDGCCTWQAARRLGDAVRRFERALLPALRNGQNLDLTPHEAALWRAYQVLGARMLRSPRKLYSLLVLHG